HTLCVCRDPPPRAPGACRPTKEEKVCLNLGSYNYLGFADDWKVTCKKDVMRVVQSYPVAMCSSFAQGGYTAMHEALERRVAGYVGKPAAMIFNMGYATNFLGIPALIGKGCLILSDSLNHTSIVNGSRSSGATIRVFKHNDPANLEALLRQAIVQGQERTHTSWKKILIMVRGGQARVRARALCTRVHTRSVVAQRTVLYFILWVDVCVYVCTCVRARGGVAGGGHLQHGR
ncbi:aminotransferase class I/II-fold pyridoxal phosphate-dependent enzyme, partial [archaeon]